jgi:hypothetical protein
MAIAASLAPGDMNKLAKGLDLTTTQLMVDNYDEADDLAAMLRRLPETEHVSRAL